MFNEYDDMIDVRDLIDRAEELEANQWAESDTSEESDEYEEIVEIMKRLKGQGGDEEWRGDWYPVTLIHENYFTEYAMDLLADIGELPRDIPRYIVIDREATAENIKVDYSTVEIRGETYYFR